MKNYAPRYRFGGAGFLELERGYQPWVIPKTEARGGAGVAVKKVKRWLRKMDEETDYEFYDWNLRSCRFKSPFDRRPLIGPRERCRKNAAKRTLRFVGSTDPDYLLQWTLHLVIGRTAVRTRMRSSSSSTISTPTDRARE